MTSDTTRRGSAVDLFSGMGGLSLGLEHAGFDINVAVDNDPGNTAVHEYLFSYGKSLTLDLFNDQTKAIRQALPRNHDIDAMTMGQTPDAIVGGPPCQGISVMGNKDPNDPRNQLMQNFIMHAAELGPKMIVMEQVPTFLQEQNACHIDGIREQLHRAGYQMVEPQIVRAIDFGVPQRRERVFLLIHRNDQPAPSYPTPTHGDADDFFLKPRVTVADAFDGLPDAADYEELWDRDWVEVNPPYPTSRYARLMMGLENDAEDLSYKRQYRRDLLTSSQRTRHDPASVERFLATPQGGSEPISRRHRLDPNGQSLTLRAGSNASKGSFTAVVPCVPNGTRVVTAREAARLHSIPDWVSLSRSKIMAYRQIGNSVCPLVGAAIGREIMKALDLRPAAPTEIIEFGNPELLDTSKANRRQAA